MKIKRLLSLLLCAAVLAVTLCACADPDKFSDSELLSAGYKRDTDVSKTFNYSDGAAEPPTSYNSYANFITGYELKLFRNMAAQGGTFAFSPAVNSLELSLLANGAKNDTLSEILLALGSELTVGDLNTCSSYFKSRMESVSKSDKSNDKDNKEDNKEPAGEIELNQYLLVNNKTDVKSSFLQSNADFYGSDIARFDYSDKGCEKKVNALLEDPVYGALDLNKDGSLCAVTSLGLSDNWLTPYGDTDMVDSTFNGKKAKMLASEESYIHSDTAKGIIKYTAKNPLKLVLIMPNENVKLEEYIKTFDSVEYSKLLESFAVTSRVNAHIPPVEISKSDDPRAMSAVMTKSGLYTLFSDKSDFSNLARSGNVRLNELFELQRGITINRYGVFTSDSEIPKENIIAGEKSGSTSPSASKAETLEFSRPFIFMLIDNESNIPVYMGIYSNQ